MNEEQLTVQGLIEKLMEFPLDAKVWCTGSDGGLFHVTDVECGAIWPRESDGPGIQDAVID
jgi:hypothetical protein